MSKRPDNHIDDPHKYRPCSCACCQKCWLHIIPRREWDGYLGTFREICRCIHGGPFAGYYQEKSP